MADQRVDALLGPLVDKQDRIRRAPSLPDASLESLFGDYTLRHAHATTAIEGNTLTVHEAQEVLEAGTTIPGKSLGNTSRLSMRTPHGSGCAKRSARASRSSNTPGWRSTGG
ncbi:MAG: hypothetical protein M0Z54_07935 [Thermaerobacter sp.]|nr:hypothetical protein [Thermaerobacter sp.]